VHGTKAVCVAFNYIGAIRVSESAWIHVMTRCESAQIFLVFIMQEREARRPDLLVLGRYDLTPLMDLNETATLASDGKRHVNGTTNRLHKPQS